MFFQTRLVYTIIICAGQLFAILYGIPNGYRFDTQCTLNEQNTMRSHTMLPMLNRSQDSIPAKIRLKYGTIRQCTNYRKYATILLDYKITT